MSKKIKLICFDLDDTLIFGNSWKKLNIALGLSSREDKRYLDMYNNSKITYQEWSDVICRIYKEKKIATRQKIFSVILNYKYKLGVKEIIRYLKNKKYILVLISGSPDILVKKIGGELDFDYYWSSNIFRFNKGNYLKKIVNYGDENGAKFFYLKRLCHKLKIRKSQCVCVGDGANDEKIFIYTKHGITFQRSKLKKISWKIINQLSDLKNIL